MPTEASLQMRAVVLQLHPLLKEAGFRKRGHSFNRTTEPGLVHVVNFQMGPFEPPGVVEIPGLRPNLYGQFIVNLGVFVYEVWQLDAIRFKDGMAPSHQPTFISEYDCQLRRRVGDLTDRSPEGWWALSDSTVVERLGLGLTQDAFDWFEGFATRSQIVTALEAAPVDSREVSGITPDRLMASRFRLALGDKQLAQRNLDLWVKHCRADPSMGGHLERVEAYALRNGMVMPAE